MYVSISKKLVMHLNTIKSMPESRFAGQRRIWALDEALKPLLIIFIDFVSCLLPQQPINFVLNLGPFLALDPLIPVKF